MIHPTTHKRANMKLYRVPVLLFICTLIICFNSFAQADTTLANLKDTVSQVSQTSDTGGEKDSESNRESNSNPKKSYFRAGLSYLSNNVYLGRKDSIPVRYLTPKLGFYTKSGFFVEGTAGELIDAKVTRLDMFSLAAGYSFSAGNYEGEVTGSKFFYNSQSSNIRSGVGASLEYYNSYDFNFIRPTISTTLNFSNKLDFASAFGLEHSFTLIEDKMDLTPTLVANASTQNYYNNYYKKRRNAAKAKASPTAVASVSRQVLNASSFKLLDYEASLPINYEIGKLRLSFVPTYAIPVHPAEIEVTSLLNNGTDKVRTVSEKLSNSFFCEFLLSFKF